MNHGHLKHERNIILITVQEFYYRAHRYELYLSTRTRCPQKSGARGPFETIYKRVSAKIKSHQQPITSQTVQTVQQEVFCSQKRRRKKRIHRNEGK